jgi:hypothetical protein
MATLHGQFPPWEMARAAAQVGRMYSNASIAVERNNHGHAVLQALEKDQKYSNIYRALDQKLGWLNTETTRTAALDALEDAHRLGHALTADEKVLGEMLVFIVNAKGKAEAAKGAHDDLVLSYAIGWDVIRRPAAARGMGQTMLG